ncbi:MAG TPA: NrsF family protein [bacterium]|nr:NrsF family protein [bacterium]
MNVGFSHKTKDMTKFHEELVGKLVTEAKPLKRAPTAWKQWLLWLGFAVLVVAVSLALIGPQFELEEKLSDPASGGFLLLAFILSAFTAWMGIASSKPDFTPRTGPRVVAAGLALFLFAMPFLFFGGDTLSRVWDQNMADGWFCFRTVVLVAIPSWVMLGWLASGNASFHPAWTGAWLGASAFLLGAGTIQLHCARWESCHMLVDHLLPMLVFIFIPIWAGGWWFSRWRK